MPAVQHSSASFIDVLDRLLDKGIVIDGWARVSVAGIDLMAVDAWVVVASIETYLRYADSLGLGTIAERSWLPDHAFKTLS
jgi:hypothetical protein